MASMEELREGVRKSLPEIAGIGDADLRAKVVEAWALALSQSEFDRIEDIPASGNPDTPPMKRGTQASHLRGVARIGVAMAEVLEQMAGPLEINRDIVIAAALCHDLGKPFEFGPSNQARWKANPAASGFPAVRHPVYGVHYAITVGLPEAVVHTVGAHSAEGERVRRGLVGTIVHNADRAFWQILGIAGALDES